MQLLPVDIRHALTGRNQDRNPVTDGEISNVVASWD